MFSLSCFEEPKTIISVEKDKESIVYKDQLNRFHRMDGPAIEYFEGTYKGYLHYFVHGKYHRIGGPAKKVYLISVWKRCGGSHRLNAPAIINETVGKEYWEFGKRILK